MARGEPEPLNALAGSSFGYDELGVYYRGSGDDPGTPLYDELRTGLVGEPGGQLGVDTSSWQGAPSWPAVKAAGKSFAYIKASNGTSSSYTTGGAQYTGARAAGLTVGLYHYANPVYSPMVNADAFADAISRLGPQDGNLPPCLDLEVGSGDLSGWASSFVSRLRDRTGIRQVLIYSGASFFADHIGEAWMDIDIALWIAHYGRPPGQPGYLSPRVALHQYSSTGRVAGIAGHVDLNYAIWPLEQLLGEGDDLTPEQNDMLVACYQYVSGSPNVGQFPGWPTWDGGTGESLTATDYLRRSNVETRQVWDAIQALQAKLDSFSVGETADFGTLSDQDVARIAVAVAEVLGLRLSP